MNLIKRQKEEKEWDKYWTKKKTSSQKVYRIIAAFYRKFIIKRTLNHFLKKEFKKGSILLHAGSGSGQVDKDVSKIFDITALDISSEALKLYKHYNGSNSQTLKASIFEIPVKDKTYDGIYNLGVHEHFTGSENEKILKEYKRILKDGGKIVLFWPPKFSLSVNFLNTTHFILNDILKRKIRLHPEEISLIESKIQVENLLKTTGFKMIRYYFGPKDLFTQCVIVFKKM
ncbi:MAG TPA: methyltransferase domain-containing protein [Candidatus Sulfotelmatobacter sp.]|nr:methyltransferase domain-containing protein [Candidatus Sulfotelmatobacter sp.]